MKIPQVELRIQNEKSRSIRGVAAFFHSSFIIHHSSLPL